MKPQYIEIDKDGKTFYYSNKKMTRLHRVDGPAVEYNNGLGICLFWYLNGKLHRENAPAVTWMNGSNEWWVLGQLHRVDGPAVEHINGYKSWHLNGIEYTEQEHAKRTKKVPTININGKEFTVEELNALIKRTNEYSCSISI